MDKKLISPRTLFFIAVLFLLAMISCAIFVTWNQVYLFLAASVATLIAIGYVALYLKSKPRDYWDLMACVVWVTLALVIFFAGFAIKAGTWNLLWNMS